MDRAVRILHVVGARPNFMKAAPVLAALSRRAGFEQSLIHTGQHYDANMSKIFFDELEIPKADRNLEVGGGSHAQQTAEIIKRFELVALEMQPDMVIVYGDVNSTAAAAIVCAKLLIPLAHVEAGLRSFDRTMPEEINRLITDQLADLLFTPSEDGDRNLIREGVPAEKIVRVGNVMIDTLVRLLPRAEARWAGGVMELDGRRYLPGSYALVTLHRPSNVDQPETFRRIIDALVEVSADLPVLLPLHPRTRKQAAEIGLELKRGQLQVADPLGYLDFLALQRGARLILSDSGGIQEESTYLGVPCLTLRENTERPITVTMGTNVLIGSDPAPLRIEVDRILSGAGKVGAIPPLWDGHAAERIADRLVAWRDQLEDR